MATLLIGELSRRSRVSSPTIRYSEQIGLLTRPNRSTTGYRRYSEAAVDELRFIRKAQTFGFSLEEIRQILTLSRSGAAPCDRVLSLARQHLATIEQRMRQLDELRGRLAAEVARWDAQRDTLTCGRLCRFIADAPAELDGAAALPPVSPSRRTRAPVPLSRRP